MKTLYIVQLPTEIQKEIKNKLISLGLNKDDIEKALSGRLCDLEDTINIKPYLNE